MAKILKEWIADDAVDGTKFKLLNDQSLKARNNTDTDDVNLFKLNTSNELELALQPKFASDPTVDNDLARKKYVDDGLDLKETASNKGAANGYCSLDANSLVPLTNIPPAALERLAVVADEAARFALTTATVQNGDTVKQTDTGLMYFIKDDTNLDNASGYEVYTAGAASSVAWSGVTGTPTTVAGYGITDVDDVAKAAAVADSITEDVTDVAPSQNAVFDALALQAKIADLASTDNGKGASTVGVEDSGAKFTATDVEGVLAELQDNIDGAVGSTNGNEVKTLSAGDISNGYVDLAQEAIAASVMVQPVGGIMQEPGVDFTLSVVSTKTRVTFAGDLLELVENNKVIFYYEY